MSLVDMLFWFGMAMLGLSLVMREWAYLAAVSAGAGAVFTALLLGALR